MNTEPEFEDWWSSNYKGWFLPNTEQEFKEIAFAAWSAALGLALTEIEGIFDE